MSWKSLGILELKSTTWHISDCLTEICSFQTINFGYQTHFFSQFTFKLHLAWNVSDCSLWVYGPGVMMVDTGTRVAPVNIAFSSSRNVTLMERKMLQYITISIKLHHWTMSEIEIQVFILPDVLVCVSIHCADQKQHLNPDWSLKFIDIANVCWHSKWVSAGVQYRRRRKKSWFL